MSLLQLHTVSTRPGRIGPSVTAWYERAAKEHSSFDVEVVDYAEVALPLFDEPTFPSMGRYEQPHTMKWAEIVDRADAFVFIMPEYDFGVSPSLTNALVYIHREWHYKPAAIVTYGATTGGVRAGQAAKLQFTAFDMVPLRQEVHIPFAGKHLDENRVFVAAPEIEEAARLQLDALSLWTPHLENLRKEVLAAV